MCAHVWGSVWLILGTAEQTKGSGGWESGEVGRDMAGRAEGPG